MITEKGSLQYVVLPSTPFSFCIFCLLGTNLSTLTLGPKEFFAQTITSFHKVIQAIWQVLSIL